MLLALAGLALFYVMFLSDDAAQQPRETTHPTTAERGPDGYFTAMRWLQRSGAVVQSLRERYQSLTAAGRGRSAAGNLLIVTLPGEMQWRTEEIAALDRWLRQGNTLLVMAALSDQPEWAFGHGANNPGLLQDLTGIEFEPVERREQRLHPLPRGGRGDAAAKRQPSVDLPRMLAVPQRLQAAPVSPRPWFDDVADLVALSDYPRNSWTARLPYDGFMLQLARDRATGEGVLWERRLGAGRIMVSAYGSSLTNRVLAEADNARGLANLVASTVPDGGAVIFDDLHQGISAAYDGRKFYADRRLWVSVTVLFAVWLTWVIGATRLRTPQHALPAPRNIDLIRAAGALLARRLSPQAAALQMIDAVLPQWQGLEHDPRIQTADWARLQQLREAAGGGRRLSLVELHNLLLRIATQTTFVDKFKATP
jgi:hypothetical protein